MINRTHYIHRIKGGRTTIILTDAQRARDKIQHFFIKACNELGLEGKDHVIRATYENPTATNNIILNGEKDQEPDKEAGPLSPLSSNTVLKSSPEQTGKRKK